jgi:trk system potassium uptake protein TrkA
MRVLILGCDQLGAHLAADLAQDGHRPTVMDSSPLCLDSLARDGLQVEAVLASESLMEDLRNVGMGGLDVFIALSEDDNKNVMAAQIASHIFHVPNVICRIGDPAREKFYRELGMNVVAPTVLVADTIKRALEDIH